MGDALCSVLMYGSLHTDYCSITSNILAFSTKGSVMMEDFLFEESAKVG